MNDKEYNAVDDIRRECKHPIDKILFRGNATTLQCGKCGAEININHEVEKLINKYA